MRRTRISVGGAMVACLAVVAGAALAGAPDASLTGPTRGGLNVVLPYYPATARAAALGTSTVALPGVDSHNPAALAFCDAIDVSLDYGRANFQHGPDLDIYRGHAVVPVPVVGGYMKLMGFSLGTRHTEMSRMGADTHVWGREFGFAYGRELPLPEAVPGRLGLGVGGFPSDPSELRLSAPGGGRLAHGRAQSKVGSIRFGTLYQLTDLPFGHELCLGAQFSHIKDELWARYPGFGIGGRFKDNYYVNLYTLGAAFRPTEKSLVLIQHLSGRAQGQGVRANYDTFSLGAEYEVLDAVALRAGCLEGELTCGLGVKLPYGFRVDYSFLPHYGHEVRRAFGHGPMHVIGVSKRF